MDHIPYPVATSVTPIEVPLLVFHTASCSDAPFEGPLEAEESNKKPTDPECAVTRNLSAGAASEVDSGSTSDWTLEFWRYPKNKGWVVSDSQSWWTSDAEETARRAQEWTYFELLRRFLGHPIDVSNVSRKRENSERLVIDSSAIPGLLGRWSADQGASQEDAQSHTGTTSNAPQKKEAVLLLLARVLLECNRLDDFSEPAQTISFAIRVLVETLIRATCKSANITKASNVQNLESNALLKQRFLRNGWCPYQIERLWGQYPPSTTYYLSSLSREPTFGGVQHDQCNEFRCMTTSIDPATYEHRHAESCSIESNPCQMVGVQSSTVAECINGGHIPLIKLEESVDGILRPSIVESHNDLRYVALSHVWSGGLGNVKANSMFSCQLRQLHGLLQTIRENGDDDLDRDRGSRKTRGMKRDLRASLRMKPLPEQPVLLWIDTLCVPVGIEHTQAYKRALAQMAQIYVQAQCVLVVDPELQKMKYKELPDEELFATVQCSSWNSRSWTFQEAAMARVFYIQFLDGYSIIDKKWHDFMEKENEKNATATLVSMDIIDTHKTLMIDVSNWFATMPVMTKIRTHDARTLMTHSEDWQNFVRVWNGLRTRSTTKSDDLYGIIAIMVDLTAYEILQLEPQLRMKAILRSQSTLPISLLYQDCPRILDSEGQPMWAPSQIAGGHLDMSSGYMSLHDAGLFIASERKGVARYSWPQIFGFSFEQPLPASFNVRLANESHILSIRLCSKGNIKTTDRPGSWLILSNKTSSAQEVSQALRGALLRRTGNKGSMITASYICPIEITVQDETNPVEEGQPSGRSNSTFALCTAKSISLDICVIRIETDITSWYKPRIRISQQLFSPWVVIRNMSNALEIAAIMLTSVLYQIATIGCAVHHRQDLVRQILYFLLARYFSLFGEGYWIGSLVVQWDKERMFRWSLRLYGKSELTFGKKVKDIILNPVLITKTIPLVAGSVSFGLYNTHAWALAKWIGIIAFAEIGVRLVYTCGLTVVGYMTTGYLGVPVSRADISDLPEDMTNYSRDWEENNKNSWWTRHVLKGERHG